MYNKFTLKKFALNTIKFVSLKKSPHEIYSHENESPWYK